MGSESHPRIRGFDHAVAPIRPQHQHNGEEDRSRTSAAPAAEVAATAEAPGNPSVPAAGEGGGAGVVAVIAGVGAVSGVELGAGGATRRESRSNARPESVEEDLERNRDEDNDLFAEGAAAAVELHAILNPAPRQQEDTMQYEDKQ